MRVVEVRHRQIRDQKANVASEDATGTQDMVDLLHGDIWMAEILNHRRGGHKVKRLRCKRKGVRVSEVRGLWRSVIDSHVSVARLFEQRARPSVAAA